MIAKTNLIRIGRLRAHGAMRLRAALASAEVLLGVSRRQTGAPSVSAEVYVHQGC